MSPCYDVTCDVHYVTIIEFKKECRVRKESGELLTNCVKKLDDREKLESTYKRLVELIKRDLERDPAAQELPENEKVRQKIIEGAVL